MGLFDFFAEIAEDVSDGVDRSKEVKRFIAEARNYIREGENIYERAYHDVTDYAFETEELLQEHMKFKKRISKELGDGVGCTLESFKQFNVDAKVMSPPVIKTTEKDINIFKSSLPHHNVTSEYDVIGDVTSVFGKYVSTKEYYRAEWQRDEALQFKQSMITEKKKLEKYKEQMREVRSFIISERSELSSLMNKVKKMTSELQTGMKKNSFTQEEADYLKGIHKITECIVTLLSTQFLSDSFKITQKYKKVYDSVQDINQSIPSSPSIKDTSTLSALNRLLNGMIVH